MSIYDNTIGTPLSAEGLEALIEDAKKPRPFSQDRLEEMRRDGETRAAMAREMKELMDAGKLTMEKALTIGVHFDLIASQSCVGMAYGVWREYADKL